MKTLLKDLQNLNIPNPPRNTEELMQIEELDLSHKKIQGLPETICNIAKS